MNIDLFLTGQSEAGLVCQGVFPHPVQGIILDAQTRELTLEFSEGETFHLNIPMEDHHKEKLLFAHRMYVGYLEGGLLMDAFETPLLYLNDPYGSKFGDASPLSKKAQRSVMPFEQFMKRCSFAQAVHRDDLGDELSARSILNGVDPKKLILSPALQRQMQLGITAAPKVGPTGPQTPGLGGGASSLQRNVKPKPPKNQDEE